MVAGVLSIFFILSFVVMVSIAQAAAAQNEKQQSRNDDSICNGFSITSPTIKNLHWTADQCYQVSYDLPGSDENRKISVDLVNSKTNQTVSALVREEAFNSTVGGTNLFSLGIGQNSTSGTYHYLVTLMYDNGNKNCEPKRSVDFQINLNPNSSSSKC